MCRVCGFISVYTCVCACMCIGCDGFVCVRGFVEMIIDQRRDRLIAEEVRQGHRGH